MISFTMRRFFKEQDGTRKQQLSHLHHYNGNVNSVYSVPQSSLFCEGLGLLGHDLFLV